MSEVTIAHRKARNWSDWVALSAVRILRWGMDTVTGYKHYKAVALAQADRKSAEEKYGMTEQKFLIRNIFLESIAGVPGMVAGMLRHMHSMRRLKRDNGWYDPELRYLIRLHLC
jgi:ubiquinol oxidase